ncbi:MAG: hypothetical protein NC543_15660 [bacterium]|nr:hypothetical protein [bacterium]MCM1376797.1 hypothetical protein [Muribaculum sp.]
MDKVTAFDALFTNNQIQKLKILISYLDSPMQRQLAIYIKFLELKYTMELLQRSPQLSVSPTPSEGALDPAKLCQEVAPYCTPQEQRQINQFASMLQAMSHYQEMMEMVKMFQEMFPEGMSFPDIHATEEGDSPGSADSDSMAAGLGSLFGDNMPDLSQLMSMMSMMQSSPPASSDTEP